MSNHLRHDQDFYAWTHEQARLLREGRLHEADIAQIAEEIESLGKSEKRELISRLKVLLLHLLKWQFQPNRRSTSWQLTIMEQRRAVLDHLADNPSLHAQLSVAMATAHATAILAAARETRLVLGRFPENCPWSFDQIINPDFWPDAA